MYPILKAEKLAEKIYLMVVKLKENLILKEKTVL